MKKRLYRNKEDTLVAGVLSGFAEYYEQDVTLYRLAFVAFLFLTGFMPGLFVYIIAWVVMPEKPSIEPVHTEDYTVYN